MGDIWKVYYPDDGHDASDAIEANPEFVYDAESVAQWACEYDYGFRDGWERGDDDFTIVVVAPDGAETEWTCRHEPDVRHVVSEAS